MALILDGIDGNGSDPVDLSWHRGTIVQVLTKVRHTVEVLRCLVAESTLQSLQMPRPMRMRKQPS